MRLLQRARLPALSGSPHLFFRGTTWYSCNAEEAESHALTISILITVSWSSVYLKVAARMGTTAHLASVVFRLLLFALESSLEQGDAFCVSEILPRTYALTWSMLSKRRKTCHFINQIKDNIFLDQKYSNELLLMTTIYVLPFLRSLSEKCHFPTHNFPSRKT
jgi:hypothetical protein